MMIKGVIEAICASEARGTEKRALAAARFCAGYGIEGDAHAGAWHRQVSILAAESVEKFRQLLLEKNSDAGEKSAAGKFVAEEIFPPGAFGENILLSGINVAALPVGSTLRAGDVILRISQIGKQCHAHCRIFQRVGTCLMPQEGVFATVERGGVLVPKTEIVAGFPEAERKLRAAVVTLSDKGAAGARADASGPRAAELLRAADYEVVEQILLPDEQRQIERELVRLADCVQVDLVITSGGTGFGPRDVTPEATLAVATRTAPGIAEAIRAGSMLFTKRAMLTRGASVIRRRTLIVNLPGSPKAVSEALGIILPELAHGLAVLRGDAQECGRK